MNQYKLRKWYPGLPKNWEVGMIVEQGNGDVSGGYTPCGSEEPMFECKSSVEDNPEFWAKYLFTTKNNVNIYIQEMFAMV